MKITYTATRSEVNAAILANTSVEEAKAKMGLGSDATLIIVDDEPKYRILGPDEVIKVGDEWKLKDGLKHKDRRTPEWKAVEKGVGHRASCFPKSQFRRVV